MIIKPTHFKNATEAFVSLYLTASAQGEDYGNGTRAIRNVGFYLDNPADNLITTSWRKWSHKYAKREFAWYMSQNQSVEELKKYAPIWDQMHNGDNLVNSNYGYQWNRQGQLDNVLEVLRNDSRSRQAYITIYDGKESHLFAKDTPCTLSIGFVIQNRKLCMNVLMRSNDIWFGFCNDQYCFSELQKLVAKDLGLEAGWYYHFAADMHVYRQQLNIL